MIEKTHLLSDLARLGIKRGQRLIVHSSLKSVGPLQGGADTLLEALMETVGPEGALAMPVFTYGLVGSEYDTPFHPVRSVSRTGALTELFRKRPEVRRSLQPTHSVAVWGRGAETYIQGHLQTSALGQNSPFHKLAQKEAQVLLIGVGFTSLSLLHVGEVIHHVYYRDIFCWKHRGWQPHARMERDNGTVETVELREVPGCSTHFSALAPVAEQEGLIRQGALGQAPVKIFSSRALLDLTGRVLDRQPDFLLCPAGTCPACDERRIVQA